MNPIDDMRAWAAGEPVPSRAELLERWGNDFLMYREAWHMRSSDTFDIAAERHNQLFCMRETQAIPEFGFSIPCAEMLDALVEHAPILEVGAGTGYWTTLMRHRGIDVIGTDPNDQNWWKSVGQYDPQQVTLEARHALRRWSNRTVFCSWPSLNEPWFLQALRTMHIGRRLILIEEDACADDETWSYRDQHFEREAFIGVPAWPGMNDRGGVWCKTQKVMITADKYRAKPRRRLN